MQKISLDYDWAFSPKESESDLIGVISTDTRIVNLPYCVYESEAFFYKKLPEIDINENEGLRLLFEGVADTATVYLNNVFVGTVNSEYQWIDVTECLSFTEVGAENILKVRTRSRGYTGIGGSVSLQVVPSIAIEDNGIFVATTQILEKSAILDVKVSMSSKLPKQFLKAELLVEVFNKKNKRNGRRLKRFKFNTRIKNEQTLKVKINKPQIYGLDNPYIYTARATLKIYSKDLQTDTFFVTNTDTIETVFGIRKVGIRYKKFVYNYKTVRLNGTKASTQNGVMRGVSTELLEQRKVRAIKDSSYNAVRVVGLPSHAFLDTCDKEGLLVFVELFDKFDCDGRVENRADCIGILSEYVKVLRNHPCVVSYSICNCAPETYGRGSGLEFFKTLISTLKKLDNIKPVTTTLTELVPTMSEIIKYIGKTALRNLQGKELATKAKELAKEHDIFGQITKELCELLDYVSYSNLSYRYQSDSRLFSNRAILGVDTPADKVDEVTELHWLCNNVLGDFCDGTDFDSLGNIKPVNIYRQVLRDVKNKSTMVAYDPDTKEQSIELGQDAWNFPHHVGRQVVVDVFTSGDVVAMYRNDEVVGRKLAGRVNKRRARFEIEYLPGTLKAVSYYKGAEHCVTELPNPGVPKALKLRADKKRLNLYNKRDLMIVDITVVDSTGQVVNFSSREVNLICSPEIEILAYGNADSKYIPQPPNQDGEVKVAVCDGRAQVVLRAVAEGKASLLATSDGLNKSTLRFSVKNIIPKSKQLIK